MSFSTGNQVVRKNYDYLFLAHSSPCKWTQEKQLQEDSKALHRVYHSVDQYVDMKSRKEYLQEEIQVKRAEPQFEVNQTAITCIGDNKSTRTKNHRRKFRKHAYEHSAYENYEIDKSPCNEGMSDSVHEKTFVSNVFFTIKSSEESLVQEQPEDSKKLQSEATDKRLKRVQMLLPTSPTHYVQPPTPDHPPPSAIQAEKSIHERIRPLSQVSGDFFVTYLLIDQW
jgi:hypothetical protein